jgi:PAS domain S-box-containing protein
MNRPRILVVEDEKVVAADIEECVKGLGYDVVGTAASGSEALRLAANSHPDLVLMDIQLKGALDGVDVAAVLHQDLKVPVIYLTAHADPEILERAKKTAPAGYILKPFDERSMRTEIEIAFDRHRRERELIEGGQRLATAVGSIDEAVIVTRANGRVALMNRLAEDLTGWKQADALGKPAGDVLVILNASTGSLMPSPIGRVSREGIGIGLGERALLLAKDGRRVEIQGSATPVRDGDGSVGICLLFRATAGRAADEHWGSPDHSSTSRLEIMGRLTTSVAERLGTLLAAAGGIESAVQLAGRLHAFGDRQPGPPVALDLNELVSGLRDLLRCVLGSHIELVTSTERGAGMVMADPAQIELILMQLAISAGESDCGGLFSIETRVLPGEDSEGGYAVLAVTVPDGVRSSATDLPALDEILRQSPGEIRIAREKGVVEIYLPRVA